MRLENFIRNANTTRRLRTNVNCSYTLIALLYRRWTRCAPHVSYVSAEVGCLSLIYITLVSRNAGNALASASMQCEDTCERRKAQHEDVLRSTCAGRAIARNVLLDR